jgi:hypothetical protein
LRVDELSADAAAVASLAASLTAAFKNLSTPSNERCAVRPGVNDHRAIRRINRQWLRRMARSAVNPASAASARTMAGSRLADVLSDRGRYIMLRVSQRLEKSAKRDEDAIPTTDQHSGGSVAPHRSGKLRRSRGKKSGG